MRRTLPILLVTATGLLSAGLEGASNAPASDTVFPGRNGKIVVEDLRSAGQTVTFRAATLNADGSGYRVVSAGPREQPRWSPDGKRLLFSGSDLGGIPSPPIRVMNANGTQARQVIGAPFQHRTKLAVGFADWLPDGKRIAFLGYKKVGGGSRVTQAGIYTIKLDGTSLRKLVPLTDASSRVGGPTLNGLAASPDGRRFAFRRTAGGGAGMSRIYVVNANGSGLKQVAKGCYEGSLDWSPDGKRLLATWMPPGQSGYCDGSIYDSGIYIVSPRGGTPRRIFTEVYDEPTGRGAVTPYAAFSPDGKLVVFTVRRLRVGRSRNTMMIMPASGGSARVIRESDREGCSDPCIGFGTVSWQPLRR